MMSLPARGRETARRAHAPVSLVFLLVTSACAAEPSAPSDDETSVAGQVTNAQSGTTYDVVAASRGSEAALVTIEETAGAATMSAVLRWLDREGGASGEPTVLAAPANTATIATDGARYVACWSGNERVTCASIAPGARKASQFFETAGRAPALAYGSGTWVLGYAGSDARTTDTRLQSFDADLRPARATTLVASAPRIGSVLRAPLLSARTGGFVAVAGEPLEVHALDAQLSPQGAPVSLDESMWFYGSLAATDARIAVSLARPYGAAVFVIDDAGSVQQHSLSGGGKRGLPIALRTEGDAMRALWFDSSWHDVPVDLAANPGESSTGSMPPPLATFELEGQRFVATAPYEGVRILRRP